MIDTNRVCVNFISLLSVWTMVLFLSGLSLKAAPLMFPKENLLMTHKGETSWWDLNCSSGQRQLLVNFLLPVWITLRTFWATSAHQLPSSCMSILSFTLSPVWLIISVFDWIFLFMLNSIFFDPVYVILASSEWPGFVSDSDCYLQYKSPGNQQALKFPLLFWYTNPICWWKDPGVIVKTMSPSYWRLFCMVFFEVVINS